MFLPPIIDLYSQSRRRAVVLLLVNMPSLNEQSAVYAENFFPIRDILRVNKGTEARQAPHNEAEIPPPYQALKIYNTQQVKHRIIYVGFFSRAR